MDDESVTLRFALLLEAYLRGAGPFLDDLIRQSEAVGKLNDIALAIKRAKVHDRKDVLTKELTNAQLTFPFSLPLNPKCEVSAIQVDQCKFMDSKKVCFSIA